MRPNDGIRDLFVGNYAGGVAFFNSVDVNGVGIKETTASDYINTYPNPAQDVIVIEINNGHTIQEHQFTLIDVLGKEIYRTTTFNKKTELSLSHLENGIYFLQYKHNTNNRSVIGVKKIIVKH